jgi:hypothetical protein
VRFSCAASSFELVSTSLPGTFAIVIRLIGDNDMGCCQAQAGGDVVVMMVMVMAKRDKLDYIPRHLS